MVSLLLLKLHISIPQIQIDHHFSILKYMTDKQSVISVALKVNQLSINWDIKRDLII